MKTVVISDLHLGVDDSVSEFVKNRSLLISFLEQIRKEKRVDEVVVNGDSLDQWFYPGDYDLTADSDAFYMEVAKNNKNVMAAFQALLKDKIRVVYVPGNHDMTLSTATLDRIVPGITQIRDARGLGRYRTGSRGEIVIEHSHRYELFCAPDPFSNKEWVAYGEPILPPGYFYARLGVTSLIEGFPKTTKELEIIPQPDAENEDQQAAWMYYNIWYKLINKQFTVNESLEERFIKVAVDGFQAAFSLEDLIPQFKDHEISAKMYKNIQRRWEKVQEINLVPNPTTAMFQMQHTTDAQAGIGYAKQQFFDLDPTVDVVVFGHTHVPAYRDYAKDGYEKNKYFCE